MAFDFKKEYKDEYNPKVSPSIINIPRYNYLAVRGKGNPNEENGDYQTTIGMLYAVAYTIKMSYKTDYKIPGFYEYVVPPLEGFWWQENIDGVDYQNKDKFNFISIIRLPDFVTKEVFEYEREYASKKKKMDLSRVEYLTYDEGLCVQSDHYGSFDNEPETVDKMHKLMEESGYKLDITSTRYHHEIYISDPRKVEKDKCKTIIRHPIK